MRTSRLTVAVVATSLAVSLSVIPLPSTAQQRPASLPEKQEEQLNAGLGPAPASLNRTTPRKCWIGLVAACGKKDYTLGAHYLNLGDIDADNQKTKGTALTRQLCELLQATDQTAADELNDTALGPMDDDNPVNYEVAAAFSGPRGPVEVWLRRNNDKKTNAVHWTVTRKTLSKLPVLHKFLIKKEKIKFRDVAKINLGLGALPAGFKLRSPRNTVELFVKLASSGNFHDAARLLDLSGLPQKKQASRGARLSRRLSMVLKRLRPTGFSMISNDSEGSPEQGVPVDQEVVAGTKVDEQIVQVRLLQFMRKGAPDALSGEQVSPAWMFSAETVGQINNIYEGLGYGWAGDYLPALFFEYGVWQVQLWQWIGMVLMLILAIIAGYMLSYITRKVLTRLAKATRWDWDDAVVAAMRGPLVMVFTVLAFLALSSFLALAETPRAIVGQLSVLVGILAAGWFLVRIVDVAADNISAFFKARGEDMAIAMVPVARKILKTLVVAIVVIVALQNMGMNVAGLLAGLGIGGLAFAMAAKTTLENLIGGITIAFDRPFKVGDYITVGGISGNVEDLGLRSTRIRTLARTLVTIPNGTVVDSKIENFAHRDKVRITLSFGLQYDTSADQLVYIVDEFKRYLVAHPRVMDGIRVRFAAFGDSSQNIDIAGYIATSDFTEFTGIQEQILLDLGRIVGEAGAEMAFPSQTVYTGKESKADSKKAKLAAKTVAERKAAGELSVPDMPDKVTQQLRPEQEEDDDD